MADRLERFSSAVKPVYEDCTGARHLSQNLGAQVRFRPRIRSREREGDFGFRHKEKEGPKLLSRKACCLGSLEKTNLAAAAEGREGGLVLSG